MFISNFARSAKNPKAVAISRGRPGWYKGRVYEKLAPPWRLVKMKDRGLFTRKYYEAVLNHLDPGQVAAELGDDAVLLCWEKPGEFCHRMIVADWLEQSLGIKIPEWPGWEGGEEEPEGTPQYNLF